MIGFVKETTYSMFKDGKLNTRWPAGFNLALGYCDKPRPNTARFITTIEQIK